MVNKLVAKIAESETKIHLFKQRIKSNSLLTLTNQGNETRGRERTFHWG